MDGTPLLLCVPDRRENLNPPPRAAQESERPMAGMHQRPLNLLNNMELIPHSKSAEAKKEAYMGIQS